MNKQDKEELFQKHINEIESLFLQAVPEMRHTLGKMDRPEDNGRAVFQIHMNDTIPGYNLSVAATGTWDDGKIQITHYKLEEKDEQTQN